MFEKIINDYQAGNLKYSYQEPGELAKSLQNIKAGSRKFYNVTSEKLDGGMEIAIAIGDITIADTIDAWAIPEFDYQVSKGGVAKGVLDRAKKSGEESVVLAARDNFQQILDTTGTNYGYAHISSGFSTHQPKAFIHVVTAQAAPDIAYDITVEAVYNALDTADRAGLQSIAFPAINTGVEGALSAQESAEAMLAGISRFMSSRDGQQTLKKIAIIVFQKDKDGKLLSPKEIIDHSRKMKAIEDKIATTAYGAKAHYLFIEALYGNFWNMMRKQGDLRPEFTVAKKVVLDMMEEVGGVFFGMLDEEEANKLKIDITSKLLQASQANPDLALSKEFLKNFIKSISQLEIDDGEFETALNEAVSRYRHELDDQIRKLEAGVGKIETTIHKQVEAINQRSSKKIAADNPKFGKLNDQVAKAKDYIEDCKKIRACVDRINKKLVDQREFDALQVKYEEALRALQQETRQKDDEISSLQQRMLKLKRQAEAMTDEAEKQRLRAEKAEKNTPITSPTYKKSY
ncbi:MAG: macro domain-containing protein [Candidatus Margulisbacteria bacterium]|nr:macro domain-containing protein [Candidatus Margulisiibacteriota bacterium]